MKGRPLQSFRRLHQCSQHQHPLEFYCQTCDKAVCVSCTVVDHDKGKGHNVVSVDEAHQEWSKSSDDIFVKMKEKTEKLGKAEAELMQMIENIEMSKRVAIDDINKSFDNLISELKQRRTVLLSDVERKSAQNLKLTKDALESTRDLQTRVKSSTDYTRQIRSKADKIEDLQMMESSTASLRAILEETLQKVPFVRTGVNFVQANIKHLRDNIKAAGMVRSVTFSPTERPKHAPDTAVYNALILEPAEFPKVVEMDRRMSGQAIACPLLEWDSGTASDGTNISGHVITNTLPAVTPPDTGCRIQEINSCLASRPLMVRNNPGQLYMYQVNLRFSLKEVIQDNRTVLEKALTTSPVDAGWSQLTGLSVRVAACSKHKQQLCLLVLFNNTRLTDLPLIQNRVGQSYDLQLGFLLDCANNKIQVLNATDNTKYTSVTDVAFDRPMWVMMYAGPPSTLEARVDLISGNNITGSFTDYNR